MVTQERTTAEQLLASGRAEALDLAQIAAQFPELRAQVAAAPNCYPDLRDWIAQNPGPVPAPAGVAVGAAAGASNGPVASGPSLDHLAGRLNSLPREERERLAGDPTTDSQTLAALSRFLHVSPALVANPSTPEQVRRELLIQSPHLRQRETVNHVEAPADRALKEFRERQARERRATAAEDRYRARQQAQAQVWGPGPQYPGGYPRQRTNGYAVASMWMAITGAGFWAICFGLAANKQIREHGDHGSGMAAFGLVIGWLELIGSVIFWIWFFNNGGQNLLGLF